MSAVPVASGPKSTLMQGMVFQRVWPGRGVEGRRDDDDGFDGLAQADQIAGLLYHQVGGDPTFGVFDRPPALLRRGGGVPRGFGEVVDEVAASDAEAEDRRGGTFRLVQHHAVRSDQFAAVVPVFDRPPVWGRHHKRDRRIPSPQAPSCRSRPSRRTRASQIRVPRPPRMAL